MNWERTLIKEICEELGITMSIISKGWITVLEKDGKTRFITGHKFDLNGHALGFIMDDKYAMYEVLSKKNIPTIEYKILFRPTNKSDYAKGSNSYEIVENYFEEYGQNIVIKANTGLSGIDVYHITDKNEISFYLDKVFKNYSSLSICPFYKIRAEYRLIVLDNECLLMYGKKKASVVGNGKATIRELLEDFNAMYFQERLSSEIYDRVLELEEVYEYSWKFNLAEGAVPFSIEEEYVRNKLLDVLKQLTSEIDLKFCSVDIIETFNHDFFIMELNSGVCLQKYSQYIENGKEITKTIYKKAIQILFQ